MASPPELNPNSSLTATRLFLALVPSSPSEINAWMKTSHGVNKANRKKPANMAVRAWVLYRALLSLSSCITIYTWNCNSQKSVNTMVKSRELDIFKEGLQSFPNFLRVKVMTITTVTRWIRSKLISSNNILHVIHIRNEIDDGALGVRILHT